MDENNKIRHLRSLVGKVGVKMITIVLDHGIICFCNLCLLLLMFLIPPLDLGWDLNVDYLGWIGVAPRKEK